MLLGSMNITVMITVNKHMLFPNTTVIVLFKKWFTLSIKSAEILFIKQDYFQFCLNDLCVFWYEHEIKILNLFCRHVKDKHVEEPIK